MNYFAGPGLLLALSAHLFGVNVDAVYRYGDVSQGAAFPCRCTTSCDPDTGACLDGGHCIEGKPQIDTYYWGERGCRLGNIALNKPAYQKGALQMGDILLTADRAVDGNLDPDASKGFCANPGNRCDVNDTSAAWWYVDLGDIYEFVDIVLCNVDSDDYTRMSNFRFAFSNTLPITSGFMTIPLVDPVKRGGRRVYLFNGPGPALRARYVGYIGFRDNSAGDARFVTICEFVLNGRLVVDCSACPSTATCDDWDGCSSCPNGTRLPDCKRECLPGWYGESCQSRCSPHCRPTGQASTCDKMDGVCTNGCLQAADLAPADWWLGPRCDNLVASVSNGVVRNLTVLSQDQTSVTLRWTNSEAIPASVASHFGYQTHYRADGDEDWTKGTRVSHQMGDQQATLAGLDPATSYQFGVSVYRVYTDGTTYEGSGYFATVTFSVKTPCATTPTTPAQSVKSSPETKQTKPTVTTTPDDLAPTTLDDDAATVCSSQTGVIVGLAVGNVIFLTLTVILFATVFRFIRQQSTGGTGKSQHSREQHENPSYEGHTNVTGHVKKSHPQSKLYFKTFKP